MKCKSEQQILVCCFTFLIIICITSWIKIFGYVCYIILDVSGTSRNFVNLFSTYKFITNTALAFCTLLCCTGLFKFLWCNKCVTVNYTKNMLYLIIVLFKNNHYINSWFLSLTLLDGRTQQFRLPWSIQPMKIVSPMVTISCGKYCTYCQVLHSQFFELVKKNNNCNIHHNDTFWSVMFYKSLGLW